MATKVKIGFISFLFVLSANMSFGIPSSFHLDTSVVNGNGTLTPPSGYFIVRSVVPLTATPAVGYQVKQWTGTDNDVSTSNTNTVTMMNNKTVTVEFESANKTYSIVDYPDYQIDTVVSGVDHVSGTIIANPTTGVISSASFTITGATSYTVASATIDPYYVHISPTQITVDQTNPTNPLGYGNLRLSGSTGDSRFNLAVLQWYVPGNPWMAGSFPYPAYKGTVFNNNAPKGTKDYASDFASATVGTDYPWVVATVVVPVPVTIDQAADQADPAVTSTINFTVVFNEPVSDFITGEVTLGGTAGATTAIVTGSGTTYNVAVSGMTQPGTVIAMIGPGVAHDAMGNPNLASTTSDNIVSFTPLPLPVLQGAVSRKTHGTAGDFDIDLPLAGTGIECRIDGPTKVIMTFDQPVSKAADFAVLLSSGTVGETTCVGNTLEINLSGSTNKTWVAIGVTGLQGADTLEGSYVLTVGTLYGDVDFSKKVLASDTVLMKTKTSPLNVTSSNFWFDIDCSGKVLNSDVVIEKTLQNPVGLP
jgi:hypothetical protein